MKQTHEINILIKLNLPLSKFTEGMPKTIDIRQA